MSGLAKRAPGQRWGGYTRASRDVPCPLRPSLAPWLSLQTSAGASWSPPPADAARARARPSSVSDRPRNRMLSRVPAAKSDSAASPAGITSVPAVAAQHAGARIRPYSTATLRSRRPRLGAPGSARLGLLPVNATREARFRSSRSKITVDFFWRFFSRSGVCVRVERENRRLRESFAAARAEEREAGGREDVARLGRCERERDSNASGFVRSRRARRRIRPRLRV